MTLPAAASSPESASLAQIEADYAEAVLRETVDANPYIPVTLTVPQAIFASRWEQEVLYGGAAGGGKLLPMNTPLPTPSGWTTMGQIKRGDTLFDEHGKPCRVTRVFAVDPTPELYRLTFDDGSELDACVDHGWLTFDAMELAALTRLDPAWRAKRRAKRGSRSSIGKGVKWQHTQEHRQLLSATITARNKTSPPPTKAAPMGTVRTTREIVNTLTTKSGRSNHAIRVAGDLETPEAALPLDPYLFGIWLGDGTTSNGGITTPDVEMIDAFRDQGWKIGAISSKPGNLAQTYRIVGLTTRLRQTGVLGFKHIPPAYLRSSVSQRLALVQGMMDTDGTVAKHSGSAEFCTTDEPLATGMHELLVSLGMKATIRPGIAKLNGVEIGPKWTIKVVANRSLFRLPRKAELQKLAERRTTKYRYIVDAQPIASTPGRCIEVDSPSHLYLAGRNMVPTHNSVALLAAALQYVHVPRYAALLLRRTFPDLSQSGGLMDLSKTWLSGTDAKWHEQRKSWTFPSGAVLAFGYLDTADDMYRYQGGGYQFIGFDELTQFSERPYTYLFSRLRKEATMNVPLRMRAGSNPGGIGHTWVFKRFVAAPSTAEEKRERRDRLFVPAKLDDNPHLNREQYRESLARLDPVVRRQLEHGDWLIADSGGVFSIDDLMWQDQFVEPGESGRLVRE